MLRFDNPGHRAELHKAGILAKNQVEIEEDDFVGTVLRVRKFEVAFLVFWQELVTDHSLIDGVEMTLNRAKAAVASIRNKVGCEDAKSAARQVENTITKADRHTSAINHCIQSILTQMKLNLEAFLPHWTPTIEDYLQRIDATVALIREQADQKLPAVSEQHQQLLVQITEKCSEAVG